MFEKMRFQSSVFGICNLNVFFMHLELLTSALCNILFYQTLCYKLQYFFVSAAYIQPSLNQNLLAIHLIALFRELFMLFNVLLDILQ